MRRLSTKLPRKRVEVRYLKLSDSLSYENASFTWLLSLKINFNGSQVDVMLSYNRYFASDEFVGGKETLKVLKYQWRSNQSCLIYSISGICNYSTYD